MMTPPAAQALRIGVTGHRSDKLDAAAAAALRPAIADALGNLARAPARGPLQIVSALAEGADRLVATEGLTLGASLLVLLPFARDLYRRDFSTAESQREFQALLDRAAAVVELDGDVTTPQRRNAAYAAVGEAVVDRSGIVIAIWNGAPASGRGGTAEIVEYARQRQRPVLWFMPGLPHNRPRLLLRDRQIDEDAVEALLTMPADGAEGA